MAEFTPHEHGKFDVSKMFTIVNDQTAAVESMLAELSKAGDSISISAMFEMQMQMNKLSQMSEMSTSVVSASNSAIASMARNVKS